MEFTFEEINLIGIFDTSSRYTLISELVDVITELDDETLEVATTVLNKLSQMSDMDFAALSLYPEYEKYEETED
jgi:hypothetical protein